MFYIYAIRSAKGNWTYIGNTENLERRFAEHNNGFIKSTKRYRPFILIFVQIVESRIKTRDLEKFLKVKWNKESLLELFAEVVKW